MNAQIRFGFHGVLFVGVVMFLLVGVSAPVFAQQTEKPVGAMPAPPQAAVQPAPAGMPQAASPVVAGVPQSGTPMIECPEAKKDFGVLFRGEKWKTTYIIKNSGTGLLKISEVKKECGCTTAKALLNELVPGATTEVQLEFDSGRFPTKIHKKVRVLSNDPLMPEKALEFVGDVTTAFRSVPATGLQIGSLQKGASKEVTIDLYQNETVPAPIKILGVECSSPLVKASLISYATGPLPQHRINVLANIPMDATERAVQADIKVLTDFPREPEIHFNIYGSIEPEIMVMPNFMGFYGIAKGQDPVRSVLLQSRQGKAFKVTGFECTVACLVVDCTQEEESTKYRITARVKKDAQEDNFRGKITVHTDLPTMKDVVINVSGNMVNQPYQQQQYPAGIQNASGAMPMPPRLPGATDSIRMPPRRLPGAPGSLQERNRRIGPAGAGLPNGASSEMRAVPIAPPKP